MVGRTAVDHYGLRFIKFVLTNIPQMEFDLGSVGPPAGVLPIDKPLLVLKHYPSLVSASLLGI